MITTASELIKRMRYELDKLNSWYVPVYVDGKPILDIELIEKDRSIEMLIKTE